MFDQHLLKTKLKKFQRDGNSILKHFKSNKMKKVKSFCIAILISTIYLGGCGYSDDFVCKCLDSTDGTWNANHSDECLVAVKKKIGNGKDEPNEIQMLGWRAHHCK